MGNVTGIVGELGKLAYLSTGKSVILPPMHMDFGMGKVGKSADVVEVHVGEENVLYIFGLVAQLFDAIDRRFVWVERHDGDDLEKFRHPGWVGIIIEAEAGVYKNQSLIGFNQKTGHAGFQFAGPAGITGETVEQVDGHGYI